MTRNKKMQEAVAHSFQLCTNFVKLDMSRLTAVHFFLRQKYARPNCSVPFIPFTKSLYYFLSTHFTFASLSFVDSVHTPRARPASIPSTLHIGLVHSSSLPFLNGDTRGKVKKPQLTLYKCSIHILLVHLSR